MVTFQDLFNRELRKRLQGVLTQRHFTRDSEVEMLDEATRAINSMFERPVEVRDGARTNMLSYIREQLDRLATIQEFSTTLADDQDVLAALQRAGTSLKERLQRERDEGTRGSVLERLYVRALEGV